MQQVEKNNIAFKCYHLYEVRIRLKIMMFHYVYDTQLNNVSIILIKPHTQVENLVGKSFFIFIRNPGYSQ